MSIIGGLRRLGWAGVRNRLVVGRRDLGDWLTAPRGPDGRKIPLQPWRMRPKLPKDVEITILSPRLEPRPSARMAMYDPTDGERSPLVVSVPSPVRRLFHIRSAIVLPRTVIMDPGSGGILPLQYFGKRNPFPALHRGFGDGWLRKPISRRDSITVDGPVFLSEAGYYIYGHVLLETIPRLLYLDRCPPGTKVLTSLEMNETYLRMFEAMGVQREQIISTAGPAHCRDIYLADIPINVYGSFNADAWAAFERLACLGVHAKGPMAERIYVSRRRHGNRPLQNEAAVEELFARHGFTIIYPEEHAIEEQIGLFANARMIAGPRGSGMHNIVFASPEARLLLLSPSNMLHRVDSYLMRRDDVAAYVLGDPIPYTKGPSEHNKWTIDLALLERALRSHFRL